MRSFTRSWSYSCKPDKSAGRRGKGSEEAERSSEVLGSDSKEGGEMKGACVFKIAWIQLGSSSGLGSEKVRPRIEAGVVVG